MQRDTKLFDIIKRELSRQQNGIELIASENFTSKQVMEAVGSVLTNKYAEGLPGKRYYGGCEFVDESENLAIERAKELFGAEWVNVQPHSGAQANAAVFLGLLKPGDKILGFNLSHGGHLTHGSTVNISGIYYNAIFYGVEKESGLLDYAELEEKAINERPKLIIAGASAYSRDWDWKRFRTIADEIGAVLMADIAHPAGIISKKLLSDPLPHCHVVTTTTHKTLRGPRGGMVMMGKDMPNFVGITTSKGKRKRMSTLLDSAIFPGTQGGPLEHVIAGKAVAFGEALTDEYYSYIKQVVENAQAMAKAFLDRDYNIITGGTDNHLMLIDLRNKNITGKAAEDALGEADITINKNMVPFDDQPPMIASGMRIGTPAVTTRGMKEDAMEEIVDMIDTVLKNADNEATKRSVKDHVKVFTKQYPLYENVNVGD